MENITTTSLETIPVTETAPVATPPVVVAVAVPVKLDKRLRWYHKMIAAGLCTCCGRQPIRQSKSGKAKLCDGCHAKQIERMRVRNRAKKLALANSVTA